MENKTFEELKKNFNDVLELQKERTEEFNKHKTEVGSKIEAQTKAADALIEKMDAIQKKNEELETKNSDLEKAFINSNQGESDEKSAEFDMNYQVIKSYKENLPSDFKYNKESYNTHKKSFELWFKGGKDALFNAGKTWAPEDLKFINTVIGPQGGFLTAPQFATSVLPKSFNGRASFELVDRINIGATSYIETVDASDWADTQSYNELGPTKPTDQGNEDFIRLTFNPQHLGYVKNISRTSLEDSFVDVSYHLDKMQMGMNRTIAGLLLNGASQDKIRGILTYPNGTAATGQVEQVESEIALSVTWDDLVRYLPEKLKTDYNTNAVYLMQHKTWRSLLVSKDDESRYQMSEILAMLQLSNAPKPSDDNIKVNIRLDAGMPDALTAGNKCVLYGDFKAGYLMVDRIGSSIIRDETDIEDIIFKLRRRVGGQLRLGEALKVLTAKSA